MNDCWLALNIGNSRLHWALFNHQDLLQVWHTPHFEQNTADILIERSFDFSTIQISLSNQLLSCPELWIASVVESQAVLWRSYSKARFVNLAQIPINETYPTLGIDRALSLWGAVQIYSSPVLVIDCGTAMTFTGVDAELNLVGGAIAPGLKLQFEALGQKTSALPNLEVSQRPNSEMASEMWAKDTIAAIQSGILNLTLAGIQAFIEDWNRRFANSAIVLTGGDAPLIYQKLKDDQVRFEPNLTFLGMQFLRSCALR